MKFVNRKVTSVNAGIQQPDYVARDIGNISYGLATYAISIAGTSSGTSTPDPSTLALADEAYGLATYAISISGTGGGSAGGVTTLEWTTEIVNLDFGTLASHVVVNTIEGDIQFTSTNQSAGKTTWVLIDNSGGYLRNIAFPGWVFVWEDSALTTPTQIQAATSALLELVSFGANEGDIMARWRTYTNPG